MASVSSLSLQSIRSQISDSTPLGVPPIKRLTKCRRNPSVVYFKPHANNTSVCIKEEEEEELLIEGSNNNKRRREAMLQILASAFSFPSIVSTALAETNDLEDFLVYSDDTNKFKISIPRGWLVGTGPTDGIRSLTAFYPKETSDSNVSVLISGLGADYTRLESFGKVDEFAETLVSGLDRSWQNPPGVAAKLINSKAAKGMYYIEYTLQKPGESCRHIISALGMASSTWYNRLYTVTGQFMEDDSEKYKSKIEKSVSSFKLT